MFDSDAVRGGICVGIYEVPAGVAFSRSFPLLAGATLRISSGLVSKRDYLPGSGLISVNNAGVPTVSAPPVSRSRAITIWADGAPAIQSGAGMQAMNDQGNVALSPAGRGLVYIGRATYTTYHPTRQMGGYKESAWWEVQVSSPTRPILVVDMSNGIRLFNRPAFVNAGGGTWTATVVAVPASELLGAPADVLATPDLYCFALPSSPAAGGVAALYDEDGSLAYDLLAGRMLASAAYVSFTPAELTMSDLNISRSIPVLSKPGLFGSVSYRRLKQRGANSATTWEGVWTMSPGQVTLIDGVTDLDIDSGTLNSSDLVPRSDGAFAEIIDLSQY